MTRTGVALSILLALASCEGGITGLEDDGGPQLHEAQSSSADGGMGDSACLTASAISTLTKQPSDIIFILDNSGSMSLEAKWVQENMNSFSQQIAASNVDFHVVVLSSYPGRGNGICIDAPLGAGGCPTSDSKSPTFLHVNQTVSSTNGLSLCLNTYPQWKSVLRPGAAKHIVIVTDDNSRLDAAAFQSQLAALDPPTFAGFKFHGIFCCSRCANAASIGSVYETLVQKTGGVSGDLCLQSFKPVFDKLATAVVEGSKISCDIAMPKPPAGKYISPHQVSVDIVSPPGSSKKISRVDGSGQCGSGGWYYDSNTKPTQIHLCPTTCTWAQGLPQAKLSVRLGCLSAIE